METSLPISFARARAVGQSKVLALGAARDGGAVLGGDRAGAAAVLRTRDRGVARGDVRREGRRVRTQGIDTRSG